MSKGVEFIKVDITDASALQVAFTATWPTSSTADITVFHTAAIIRFYERHARYLDRSLKVNVEGTRNVIEAARAAGANVLVYTSSATVGVHGTGLLLLPWKTEPQRYVQILNDDNSRLPEEGFSNYATVKVLAEHLVTAADKTQSGSKVLRTGCVRPGNGIVGPYGDLVVRHYLQRKSNPVWVGNVIQSFSYVENCAEAHLCYEARLIDLLAGSKNPDIGGQAFCITDPGPTPTFGDVYTTIGTLVDGVTFSSVSATFMLLMAYCVEFYCRVQYTLKWLPPITGEIINLQPGMFRLTQLHVIVDDSRARLPPSQGGLGYKGTWTTLEGVHRTVEEYKSSVGSSGSQLNGGNPKSTKVADAMPHVAAPLDAR